MHWLWSVACFLGIGSILQELANECAIDYTEGEMVPHRRWITWGMCYSLGRNPAYDFRYVLICLPSWRWEQDIWGRFNDADGWRWYQRAFLRFNGHWRETMVPA